MKQAIKDFLGALTLGGALFTGSAEAVAPPPALHFRTKELIESLGSDSWAEREKASEALSELVTSEETGRRILPYLKKAVACDDPEVRARARRLVARYYNVNPTDFPVIPWIDSLPSGDPRISKYLKLATDECGASGSGPDFPTHRFATKLMVRDMIDAGTPRKEIVKLLDQMVLGDREQAKKENHRLADGLLEK